MKTFLQLCLLTIALGTAARADLILTWDTADQTAVPGDLNHYFGTIVNTGTDTVYINGDDFNFSGAPGLNATDMFSNTVFFLGGGEEQDHVELISIGVSDPYNDAYGKYTGTYTILGGADPSAMDVLTSPSFSITVNEATVATPEPGTFVMLGAGIFALAAKTRSKRKNRCN